MSKHIKSLIKSYPNVNGRIIYVPFKKLFKLPIYYNTTFIPNNNRLVNEDKVKSIREHLLKEYINKKSMNTIGTFDINYTDKDIYLLDGLHRYNAYLGLYYDFNITDINIFIDAKYEKDTNAIKNNFNIIRNVKQNTIFKRKTIPRKLKYDVWDKYIGPEHARAKCYCCRTTVIEKTKFTCGHIKPVSKGGDNSINNLKPICEQCNLCMGSMNMVDYIKLYYPENYNYFIKNIPQTEFKYIKYNPTTRLPPNLFN